MKNIYITTLVGEKREINWIEYTSITKDILWHFHQNFKDPINVFIPADSFIHKYWEFLTIEGNKYFYEDEKEFLLEGCLALINGMICEYIDIPGGYQQVFQQTSILEIMDHIENFQPESEKQERLKEITILGLHIAASITPEDILKNLDYNHDDLNKYYELVLWINENIIKNYYIKKLKDKML